MNPNRHSVVNPRHWKLLEEARNLDRLNQRQEALPIYQKYLELEPGDAGGWVDYGGLLMVMGKLEEARQACERALRIDGLNLGAMVNLGCVLIHRDQLIEAEGYFRRVLVRDPRQVDARMALAECLVKAGNLDEAKLELDKLLQFDPGHHSAHQLLGQIFFGRGLWPEFQKEIKRYQEIHPDSPYIDYERGYLSLLFGDLPQGWPRYEARLKVQGLVGPERHFAQPQWQGESFVGRTLLLHFEQGFGDTLMFVRFAPQVKALGGRVILEAQAHLADLVATCQGVDGVIPHGAPIPPFDLQLSLLSLPKVFNTSLGSIPADIPYLDIPAWVPNRKKIAQVLSGSHGKIRIGLVWAGSSIHKNDGVRSIPAAILAPLASLSGVAWHSFQLGVAEEAPLPTIANLGPLLSNFSDTAYALSGMDLVITVDTALAHLAGALGIPVFLLVPFSPDWRWMLGRSDSPWYPSMRIFRQPNPGNWEAVIQQVIQGLA